MHTFLSVGFAPSAALVTWQLEQSGAFQTFTYWPTHTIKFSTEIFGNQSFQPNQLDLSAVKDPQPFDYVLVSISSLKDVNRMVKKIDRFVSKNTSVLINVPEGAGMLQRLFKSQLSKIPVSAFICDFPVRHIPDSKTNIWEVIQWGNSKSPGPQMAVHIEPTAPKLLGPLEAALTARGMPCSHAKNASAFMAIQWERSIFTIGFELMTIIFNCPSVEKLITEQMARPIIEGVVNELLALASAMGAKTLPSCSHFVQQSPVLTRKAPSIFAIPHASRLFYEFYSRAPIHVDVLLLAPILLADDIRKARTPYLESLYAFTTQLQTINVNPTDLFARADLEAKQRQLDREYELEHGNSNVAHMEQQLQHALLQCEQRESQAQEIETAYKQREAALTEAQAALDARHRDQANLEQRYQQLKVKEDQFAQREDALTERSRRLEQRERDLDRAERSRKPMSRTNSSTQLMSQMQVPPQTPKQQMNGWDNSGPGPTSPTPQTPFMTPGYARPRQSRQMPPQLVHDTHVPLKARPQSQVPPPTSRRGSQAPLPENLDMMSMTSQKNRRQSMRNGPARSASMTSISAANGGGSYSQTFQLDGIMGLASQDRYSMASTKKPPRALSADHTLGANRPFGHGFSNGGNIPGVPQLREQKSYGQMRIPAASKADADFTSFGYSYDAKHSNSGSQGSGSMSGSGNSRSPPRSPSVTPPTPNTLDPSDIKEPYKIPGV